MREVLAAEASRWSQDCVDRLWRPATPRVPVTTWRMPSGATGFPPGMGRFHLEVILCRRPPGQKRISAATIPLPFARNRGHHFHVASGWRLAIQGKLTMSMMNSKFAMKSVLMMGAAAGLMMAAGGARAQSGGYTFTPVNDPL